MHSWCSWLYYMGFMLFMGLYHKYSLCDFHGWKLFNVFILVRLCRLSSLKHPPAQNAGLTPPFSECFGTEWPHSWPHLWGHSHTSSGPLHWQTATDLASTACFERMRPVWSSGRKPMAHQEFSNTEWVKETPKWIRVQLVSGPEMNASGAFKLCVSSAMQLLMGTSNTPWEATFCWLSRQTRLVKKSET